MTRPIAFLLASAVALLLALSVLTPWSVLRDLFDQDPGLGRAVVVELRLPRALLALFYGAMLGAAGAAIQALFANPLASPDLTGTTSGAALGAVVTAYLIGLSSPLALSVGAVAGALAALLLLLALAGPRAETATLLLSGLAISALAGALTTLALALAPSPFAFYDAYDWLMGSLVDRSLAQAAFAGGPALLTVLLLLRLRRPLDLLTLGEDVVQSLGHDLRRLRIEIVALTAIGVGACVAICGAIGFVGLVAPIFARRISRGHPGGAILPAALIGGGLLLAADLVTRAAPLGRVLPIGVVTALLGAPFFLWLVAHMRWSLSR
ncbi:iron ABC transporter permease [Sphingosinicella sp. BN140058]|uniref:FecCD family ABC transporter permease n=1 Tax=Sphingosinicella sp. BN140058 TaxID=1892855 RepID=UPI001011CA92|nr:iron ABC transporter permease [Sphingosinicella sp. BN140058]QAY79387.1 iron ABC transporter permease [Sphingosinicella sp. BN140058]